MNFAFFSDEKLSALQSEIATAAATPDAGARLMSYARIYMTSKDGRYEQFMTTPGKWISRAVMLVGVAALGAGVLLGSVFTGGCVALVALGGVQLFVHTPTLSRYGDIMADLRDDIADAERETTLPALAQSPQLDAVMLTYPRLREKFQQAIDQDPQAAATLAHSSVLRVKVAPPSA